VPGAQPPNVCPYRYPFTQKNEIEKIIKELLEVGVIHPSISPYSSPVVMVLKKDGEWPMCPDFRALKRLTIKPKFPILVVDDLLDELNGAQFFTKLDLFSAYHQIRMKELDIPRLPSKLMNAIMNSWSFHLVDVIPHPLFKAS